jgi:hypothetical protein
MVAALTLRGDRLAMQDLINIFAGNTAVFGYSVPTVWLIAGALLLPAAVMRSAPLTMVAGLMLFTLYFIPTMAGG